MKESEAPYSKTKLSFMFTKTTPDFLLMSSKLLQIAIGSSSCDLFGDKGFLAGLSWLGLNTLRLPLDCQKKALAYQKQQRWPKKSLAAQNGSIRLKDGTGNGVPFLMLSQSAGFPLLRGELFFISYGILT